MATTIAELEARVRRNLNEPVARFWSSAELLVHLTDAMKNLWRAYYDTHQDYFLTIDDQNVSLDAGDWTLTGVPDDVAIVRGIEPRDLALYPNVQFRPADYLSPEFTAARSQSASEPGFTDVIYYAIHGAGGPVNAPTIRCAPRLSATLDLTFIYVPTLPTLVVGDNNPVPGESDDAIVAWATAHALAKSAPDGQPDAGWVQKFTAGKEQLRTAVTPRQTHEPEVVPAFFEYLW